MPGLKKHSVGDTGLMGFSRKKNTFFDVLAVHSSTINSPWSNTSVQFFDIHYVKAFLNDSYDTQSGKENCSQLCALAAGIYSGIPSVMLYNLNQAFQTEFQRWTLRRRPAHRNRDAADDDALGESVPAKVDGASPTDPVDLSEEFLRQVASESAQDPTKQRYTYQSLSYSIESDAAAREVKFAGTNAWRIERSET